MVASLKGGKVIQAHTKLNTYIIIKNNALHFNGLKNFARIQFNGIIIFIKSFFFAKLVQTKQTSKRKAKNVLLSMRLWVKPNLFKVSANESNVKEKSKECAFISAFVSEAYNNSSKSLRYKCQNILSLILNHINSSN